MQKFSYHKKYHYLLKYFIMAFPLIVFVCLLIGRNTLNIDDASFDFLYDFANTPLNQWYNDLLIQFGIYDTFNSSLAGLLSYYPLYILWVYIMDLILDIFALVPKLAHKLLYKLGGGIDD